MRFVPIGHITAKVILHFGMGLLDRLDFLACVFALELVEQIPKRLKSLQSIRLISPSFASSMSLDTLGRSKVGPLTPSSQYTE